MNNKVLFVINFIFSVIGFMMIYAVAGVFNQEFSLAHWFILTLAGLMLNVSGFIQKSLMDDNGSNWTGRSA